MEGKAPEQISTLLGIPVHPLKKHLVKEGWFHDREELRKKAREQADAEVLKDRRVVLAAATLRQYGASTLLYTVADQINRGLFPGQKGHFLASVLGRAAEIERKVLRMDEADGRSRESSLLDSVLDELIESGEIKGPVANVSAGASDGGSREGTAPAGASEAGPAGP